MNDIKVSIIIPIYNASDVLERCISSVLKQTYQNIEVLLIDDGSRDKSGDLCDEFAGQDKRIRVFHKENGGVSSARNLGLENSTGQYIMFVDSDDYCSDILVEELVNEIINNDVQMVICNYIDFSKDIPNIEYTDATRKKEYMESMDVLWRMRSNEGMRYTAPWGKLYSKSLFHEIRYPIGRISEDEATTYKLIDKCNKIAVIKDVLYFYYVGNVNSITSDRKYFLNFDIYKAYEEQEKYFRKRGYDELAFETHMTYLNSVKYRYQLVYALRAKIDKSTLKKYKNLYRNKWKDSKYKIEGKGYYLFYCFPYIYAFLMKKKIKDSKLELWLNN